MNPKLLFHKAASNIICQVLFAKHFDYEDEFLEFFANHFNETSKIINGPSSIVSNLQQINTSIQKGVYFGINWLCIGQSHDWAQSLVIIAMING